MSVTNDEWLRTVYAAATPGQRVVIREIVEAVVAGKDIDEVSLARFRKRFGNWSSLGELRAVLDDLAYREAVSRQHPPP